MHIFKLIEIDLEKERARINKFKDKRQEKALNTLVDLFEAGEWQKCLDWVRDTKNFPYNEEGEYPELEHINMQISDILHDLSSYNFYTSKQLLDEAKEKLSEDQKDGRTCRERVTQNI